MSFAFATGWDAEEARVDGGAEAAERADDAAEELRWLESLAATAPANTNGETRDMEPDPKFDQEDVDRALTRVALDQHSGVYKALGSRPLTVQEIDALPTVSEREEQLKNTAVHALSVLRIEVLHRVLAEMLSRMDDERFVAMALDRSCRLSTEDVGHVAQQLMQRLFNQYAVEKRIADSARDRQRAAESVICRVLGDNAVFALGVEE